MSSYKVPQDVEADDKILGPFSFRQFVYLIVVALAGAAAWGLSQLFLPLAFIPVPIIIFFGALALPLRKDQPMETFLAAMIAFYLKPRKRLWDPDGVNSLIEITVPTTPEIQRTKDITQGEAENRLNYLANIVDSRGWAVRGPGIQAPDSAMNSDAYFEAQQTTDFLDDDTRIAKTLDQKLNQDSVERHQVAANIMSGKINYFDGILSEPTVLQESVTEQNLEKNLDYNPYPDIQQTVIQPLEDSERLHEPTIITAPKPVQKPTNTQTTTSNKVAPAVIMKLENLANNQDYTVETMASEAKRILEEDKEVFIPLR